MKLVIHAHTLKNELLSQAITGHFDERGGTIGRSDANTLVLPDPDRHVSRLQAEVRWVGRAFSILNVGSANSIELNGRALRPGEGAPVAAGDRLVIGGYVLRAVVERTVERTVASAAVQASRVDSRTIIRASPGPEDTGLGITSGLGGQGGDKVGADLFDKFFAPTLPAHGRAVGDGPDLSGDSAAGAADLTAPAAFDHTPGPAGTSSPSTMKVPAPTGTRPPVAMPPQVTAASPPLARAEVPSPRAAASPPPEQPVAAADAAHHAAHGLDTPDALWRAFCEGSGQSMALPQGLNPQMMRVMGQLMRHAVEGALKLVAARAAAKQEWRPQAATIRSKNNNPLKFSVDAQQVLAQLLHPPIRGFMSGPEAMRDAMDDLLGHQIGTMAGTRAALQGMFKRFEPALLEARLSNKGVVDAVLPMNRRAKLWELYLEHYPQVQGEAQDDFHELFGIAFVKAYEQQLDRLEASRRKDG